MVITRRKGGEERKKNIGKHMTMEEDPTFSGEHTT